LINYANAPIIVWDPQFRITRFNHAFEFLTGLLEKDMIGKSLEILFPPSKKIISMALISETSTGERWETVEIDIMHKDLSKRTLLWNSATIMDQEGKKPIATIAQGQDITERKKIEKELRESEKLLKKAESIAQLGVYSLEISTGKLKSSTILDSILGINDHFARTIEGWSKLIHPEWRQIMMSYLTTEVIAKKLKFDKEYKIIRPNDLEERWVHGLGELIFNDQKQPLKMIGTIQDITDRKKNEEKLLQLSQAVEQSPVTIVITDTKGAINYVNPQFTETTGFTYEEALGQNPRIMKSGHTSSEEYKNLWKTISKGKNWHGEFHNKKKNGDLYWESASISPIINSLGETTHYIAIKEDITERKLAEKKLIIANQELAYENKEKEKRTLELFKAKEQAEESDRLKSAFLANMSHEIRTPMNGILGFTELLKEPNLRGEDQQEYIKIIQESGTRMLNIINDIIDISKIESKQMKTVLTATSINDKIKFVYNFFKPEVEKKGMQLLFKNTLPDKESVIVTDNEKVYAILTNLVKNAIKFTDKGSIELGYKLKTESKPPELEFYVKDTGVGIPKDKQQAIFDRFIQANLTDKRAFEGAGLGLSISKAYVELLGGKLWVESEEGKGSTFYFTIPYNTDQKEEIPSYNTSLEQQEEKPIEDLKILIVEDDKISNLLITKTVKKYSKEILKASTGFEAVEACRNNPDINLVLMDVNMPEMNGYEATKQIRQFNKKVVIIAQTAYGMASDREDALASGCTDYISKPIKIEVLKDLIQKYFKN
jgi:PAS domain S-box-containing protein